MLKIRLAWLRWRRVWPVLPWLRVIWLVDLTCERHERHEREFCTWSFKITELEKGRWSWISNRARCQSGFLTFISCQRQDANVLPKRRQSHQGDKLCDVSTVPLMARWPVFLARGSDADGEPHCSEAFHTDSWLAEANPGHSDRDAILQALLPGPSTVVLFGPGKARMVSWGHLKNAKRSGRDRDRGSSDAKSMILSGETCPPKGSTLASPPQPSALSRLPTWLWNG